MDVCAAHLNPYLTQCELNFAFACAKCVEDHCRDDKEAPWPLRLEGCILLHPPCQSCFLELTQGAFETGMPTSHCSSYATKGARILYSTIMYIRPRSSISTRQAYHISLVVTDDLTATRLEYYSSVLVLSTHLATVWPATGAAEKKPGHQTPRQPFKFGDKSDIIDHYYRFLIFSRACLPPERRSRLARLRSCQLIILSTGSSHGCLELRSFWPAPSISVPRRIRGCTLAVEKLNCAVLSDGGTRRNLFASSSSSTPRKKFSSRKESWAVVPLLMPHGQTY